MIQAFSGYRFLFSVLLATQVLSCGGQNIRSGAEEKKGSPIKMVRTGADILVSEKLSLIQGKKVGIIANHTSLLGGKIHLVDTLHSLGIDIQKIFGPEHGFRGDHGAGEKVSSDKDAKTGIPIVSLYGATKKPTSEMLSGIDVLIFDIQDVGARFYTYISTLSLAMEACAENKISFLVLDRPNPNGWYVDGPVLESAFSSFVGMHPIPIVHGMTIGEYALMVNKEGWLKNKVNALLTVIPCENYSHTLKWEETGLDWIAPSPNLATPNAAYLYPILCWYEGMPVSIGRGTDYAFELVGAPWHIGYKNEFTIDSTAGFEQPKQIQLQSLKMEVIKFTPRSIPEKAPSPIFQNEPCYGVKFINQTNGKETFLAGLELLSNFYSEFKKANPNEEAILPFFYKLTGTEMLAHQLESGKRPQEMYESWRPGVNSFLQIRKKYLLYPDFQSGQ